MKIVLIFGKQKGHLRPDLKIFQQSYNIVASDIIEDSSHTLIPRYQERRTCGCNQIDYV